MSSMTGLSIALSGLSAAQLGLSVTGQNISNAEVKGYTRQQAIQQFYRSSTVGSNQRGLMQVGLGTSVSQIRQIRNQYFDVKYRDANTTAGYYTAKYTTGTEIEDIIGELESDYKAQDVLSDVWDAINDLTLYPDGIETRTGFIQTCVTFMDKIKNINDNLYSYQLNLNEQIKDCVSKINTVVSKIDELNKIIVKEEMAGNQANDYRDERNNCLDELSNYLDITVKETNEGRVDILVSGTELLVNGSQNYIGLRYCNGDYPFVEPVFTTQTGILPPTDTEARLVFRNLDEEDLTGEGGNTNGFLKGLLASRGEVTANYLSPDKEVGNYLIPKIQKKLDTLFNGVVTLLNEAVVSTDANPRYDLNGNLSHVEIFSRVSGSDANGNKTYYNYNDPVDENNIATCYSMYNTVLNPKILETDGYNYLAFSTKSDYLGDPSVLNQLSKDWKTGLNKLNGLSIDEYYNSTITSLGIEIEEAASYYNSQASLLDTVENDRTTISGVSLDEELTYMLKYQHAYNAASRMVSIIDSMLDKVINGTGRGGL